MTNLLLNIKALNIISFQNKQIKILFYFSELNWLIF